MSPSTRNIGKVGGGERRSRLLLVSLIGSLVLVALLSWQAVDAARSHRATATAVLGDYARLALDEYVRRTANEIGYYGYYPLLTAVRQLAEEQPGRLPTRSEVEGRLDAGRRRALELAGPLFRIGLEPDGTVQYDGESAARDWLVGRLRELGPDGIGGEGIPTLHGVVDGSPRSFVFDRISSDEGEVVGFEVRLDRLGPWFRQAFERGPLLPPSVAGGEANNAWVFLAVLDPAGKELFRSPADSAYEPVVYGDFGDAYSGILSGTQLRASVATSAADRLVIGGLPRSRLPLLVGLFVLTAGTLVVAIHQLRREQALARLRSDFVSRVSHELRTPLTQIRMFAETLLLDRVRSEDEERRSLQIIDREARRLTHLVENLLQFSRSERGTTRLSLATRNLAPLVQEMVEEFTPVAGHEGVTLRTRLTEVAASVDDDAMRQVLLNLLDNAVKYGPEGQEVTVGMDRDDGVVRIWIDDEGPGVPAGDRERIWKRFRRLDRATEAAAAGTGIGLAVVRELVTLHHGRSWVESGERGGARFIVELPVAVGGHP